MIKTETALTLNRDDESQLRELLHLLEASFPAVEISEGDKPNIRELVWNLQKKLKRAGVAASQSRQATAQRAA